MGSLLRNTEDFQEQLPMQYLILSILRESFKNLTNINEK